MRKEGIIENLDPREPIDAILNLVITDKKTPGKIRIKVDATPINKGAKMNKLQVKTAAEVRHDLESAVYFSFTSSQLAVLQNHKGRHRMKRFFLRPKVASDIFHYSVLKCTKGLEGLTTHSASGSAQFGKF